MPLGIFMSILTQQPIIAAIISFIALLGQVCLMGLLVKKCL